MVVDDNRAEQVLLSHGCSALVNVWEHLGGVLEYIPFAREFCIRGEDGSFWQVANCPFCGAELPRSLRHDYFARFDEYPADPDSDAWWREDPLLADLHLVAVPARHATHPTVVRPLTARETGFIRAVLAGTGDAHPQVQPVLPGHVAAVHLDGVEAEIVQVADPDPSADGPTGWVVGEPLDEPELGLVAAVRVVRGRVVRFWCVGWDATEAPDPELRWDSGWTPG